MDDARQQMLRDHLVPRVARMFLIIDQRALRVTRRDPEVFSANQEARMFLIIDQRALRVTRRYPEVLNANRQARLHQGRARYPRPSHTTE